MDERGTSFIEMLVLGFAIVVVVLPVFSLAARLADASGRADAVAVDTATWIARHGVEPAAPPDVRIEVTEFGDAVAVVAHTDVSVVSVGGGSVTLTVTGGAVVPVSPFRSGQR